MGFTGFPLCSPTDSILLDRCGFGAGFHGRLADGQSWLWFGGGFHCWPADRQSLLCSLVVGQSLLWSGDGFHSCPADGQSLGLSFGFRFPLVEEQALQIWFHRRAFKLCAPSQCLPVL